MKQIKRLMLLVFTLTVLMLMSVSVDAAFSISKSGVSYPTTIKAGTGFTMKGTLKSNTAMKKIVFTIYNSTGKNCLQRYTVIPNSTTYDISEANDHLTFETLTAGTYYYRICAYNANNTKLRVMNKKFKVTGSTKTIITKKGVTVPSSSFKQGTSFAMKGTITSTTSLKSAVFTIYNAATGKCLQKYTATNIGTSYDISKANGKLNFSKLTAGSYYYRISVYTSASKKVRIVNNKFTVTSSSAASSSIKISNPVPSSAFAMSQGRAYGLGGTITSSYTLTKVTGEILNESGNTVYSKTVSPSAKTYTIAGGAIDNALAFDKLNPGMYSIVISATDSKGTRAVLVNRTFFVNAAGSQIAITNPAPSADKTISKGASLAIGGKITSRYAITYVKAKLTNTAGNVVYSKTVSPNTGAYTLDNSAIDTAIYFNKLSAGTYYLNITVTDKLGTVKNVISKKIVVK